MPKDLRGEYLISNWCRIKRWSVQNATQLSDKWRTAWISLAVRSIGAENAVRYIRQNQKKKATLPKLAYLPFACMSKAVVMGQLGGCWRSIHKVLPIGWIPTPLNCPKHRYPRKWKRLNWMSYSLLLARKKRNLRSNYCGSRHTLYSELGCCARTNIGSLASLPGACATSQAILFGCFSSLWHTLLRCTLRNAHRQTGDLFSGSCQCWSPTLPQTAGTQVTLFHQKATVLDQKPATLCLLLQPQTVGKASFS